MNEAGAQERAEPRIVMAPRVAGPMIANLRTTSSRVLLSLPPGVKTLLGSFLGWTIYALLAAQLLTGLVRPQLGMPRVPFGGMFRYVAFSAWTWALLTPVVIAFARRFAIRSWPDLLRRLPLHLAFAVLMHVTHELVLWAIPSSIRPGPRQSLPDGLFGNLIFNFFLVGGLIAMVHAMSARGETRRLEHALLESELRQLRLQLQPHFLFNTLNGVAELVHLDPARAERALVRLADLLRWSLQSSSLGEVTLKDELGALETYLEIQKLRHGEGLRFEVEAAPELMPLAVPSLLLQPLVENAIRHGVRGAERGTVRVRAVRDHATLELSVEDTGRGFEAGWREGTGLGNTRARLRGLYGRNQELRVTSGPQGAGVLLRIPARMLGNGDRT